MIDSRINGRVVVLTGASSGIGRAAALEFSRHGAKLVLAARDANTLVDVAEECKRLGAEVMIVPTDVTDSEAMHRLADTAAQVHGSVDIWINNAGIGAVGTFDQTPMRAHEQVVQTDLLGYMRGAHAALPYFKRQQAGILINTLSLGSWVAQPYAVAYSAAKSGLRGFSEALHGEMSRWPDINVCDIYPSFIDSPALRDAGNYSGRALKPLPPVYAAHKVAQAMISLAERPRRSTTIGRVATLVRIAHSLLPGYSRFAARATESLLGQSRPVPISSGNLFHPPAGERRITGGWRARSVRRNATMAGLAGTAAVCLLLSRRHRR